jgi:hypothetical protein
MDFDPRWTDDPRNHDDRDRELDRGSRGGLSNPRERERLEPRDVFTRDLDLPRGPERQRVWARDSDVRLRGSEVRTLATVGAFRVVPAGDLRDGQDRPLDPNRGDLRHLRDQGLVETIPTIGEDRALVVLTERGRDVLERNRWSNVRRELQRTAGGELRFDDGREVDDERYRPREQKREQEFYAGVRSARHTRFAVQRPRELTHDSQVYRAYLKEAERLREDNALIRRVLLDHELKREYQQFLQERNRGKSDSDGRPDRTPEEIHRWALERELPEHDGHVRFEGPAEIRVSRSNTGRARTSTDHYSVLCDVSRRRASCTSVLGIGSWLAAGLALASSISARMSRATRLSLLAVTFAAARGCASLRLQPSVEDGVQERLVQIEAGRLEPFQ